MTPPREQVLHDGLEAGLRRVALTDRLLVASDFDGTLAPIVDRPDAVQPDLEALAALRRLAELDDTLVAVVSGRSRAVLEQHLGQGRAARSGPGLILVGSHGAELDPAWSDEDGATGRSSETRDPADDRALHAAGERLDALADEYPGAIVERKPTAVAFHFRRVEESSRDEAAQRAAALVDGGPLRVQAGHLVVELVAGDVNKGDAIDALRRTTAATATVFVGDDRTDEHAFARLGPGDLGVKIGPGSTCAPVRISSQREVASLYRRLHALRVARG